MSQNYTPEFKKKMVCLHEEEERICKNIAAEYGVCKAGISYNDCRTPYQTRTAA